MGGHAENCDPEFGCDESCAMPLPPEDRLRAVAEFADELVPNLVWGGDVTARLRAILAGETQ